MILRRARREDVPAIVALFRDDALSTSKEEDPAAGLPDSYYEAFDEIAASPNAELHVAEQDGRVVACLQIDFLRRLSRRGALTAELESVHVHSSLRGQGIGEALVRAAVARARERGCVRVQLTSQKVRVDAHRFYERLGFARSHDGFKLLL